MSTPNITPPPIRRWKIVQWVQGLRTTEALSTYLDTQEVSVWRAEGGKVFHLNERCPRSATKTTIPVTELVDGRCCKKCDNNDTYDVADGVVLNDPVLGYLIGYSHHDVNQMVHTNIQIPATDWTHAEDLFVGSYADPRAYEWLAKVAADATQKIESAESKMEAIREAASNDPDCNSGLRNDLGDHHPAVGAFCEAWDDLVRTTRAVLEDAEFNRRIRDISLRAAAMRTVRPDLNRRDTCLVELGPEISARTNALLDYEIQRDIIAEALAALRRGTRLDRDAFGPVRFDRHFNNHLPTDTSLDPAHYQNPWAWARAEWEHAVDEVLDTIDRYIALVSEPWEESPLHIAGWTPGLPTRNGSDGYGDHLYTWPWISGETVVIAPAPIIRNLVTNSRYVAANITVTEDVARDLIETLDPIWSTTDPDTDPDDAASERTAAQEHFTRIVEATLIANELPGEHQDLYNGLIPKFGPCETLV